METSVRGAESKAWTQYWSKMSTSSVGCLPNLPASVAGHLREIWEEFFGSIPEGASLLDLGTGDGGLLRHAGNIRSDLQLTGIDYARVLPYLGDGITLHPNTSIEELPFADNSFAAIVGQFAVEYADIEAAAGEINRVLTENGDYLFVCHHAGGVIVKDNLARLAALRAILSPAGLLDSAVKLVRQREKSAPETRHRLARLFDALKHKYPGQRVVDEAGLDIARIMSEPDTLRKLLDLRIELEMEGKRIAALGKAALSAEQARKFAALLPQGKVAPAIEIVTLPGTELPFAWKIICQSRERR